MSRRGGQFSILITIKEEAVSFKASKNNLAAGLEEVLVKVPCLHNCQDDKNHQQWNPKSHLPSWSLTGVLTAPNVMRNAAVEQQKGQVRSSEFP